MGFIDTLRTAGESRRFFQFPAMIPKILPVQSKARSVLATPYLSRSTRRTAPPNIFDARTTIPVFREKGFSERESHVALKLLEGLPNIKIANQLYISESTMKKHIQNLFRKCGAANRHDFVSLYQSWGNER